MLPAKFWFIWRGGFRGEDFLEKKTISKIIAFGCYVC
jgi:hypothetical protein